MIAKASTAGASGLLLLLLTFAEPVAAHPSAPSGLLIRDHGGGELELVLRRPKRSNTPAWRLTLVGGEQISSEAVQAGCLPSGAKTARVEQETMSQRQRYRCGSSDLSGASVTLIDWTPQNAALLVQLESEQGRVESALLSGETRKHRYGADARSRFRRFTLLGVWHMLGGLDHLLFVAGLFLIARGRRLWLALTGFTLGHSLTLGAATLGWLRLDPRLVETAIALSLMVLARRIVIGGRQLPARRLVIMCGAVGLLHGLGFWSALEGAGLSSRLALRPLLVALLSFNLGIELAQVGVAVVLMLLFVIASRRPLRSPRWRSLAGHLLGGLAATWALSRVGLLP